MDHGSKTPSDRARVMVNRLWHYVFGRGLVGTPSDFGKNGLRPSHPDLLDWLAADEFLQSNGSIKSLLRILLTSETFKQQSQPRESGLRMDATGELLGVSVPDGCQPKPSATAFFTAREI